jgi:glycosyltransferase involved in cell wall biosynthesis
VNSSPKFFVIASIAPDAVSAEQTGTTVCMLKLLNAILELGPVTLFTPAPLQGPLNHADRLTVCIVKHLPKPSRVKRAWRSFTHGVVPSMWADESADVLRFLRSSEAAEFQAGVLLDEYAAIYMSSFPASIPLLFIRHNLFGSSWTTHGNTGLAASLRSKYHHWLARRFDRWTTRAADAVLAGTTQSVERLKQINSATPALLLPTTSVWASQNAPASRPPKPARADGRRVAVFLGNFNYEPNSEAVLWFMNDVLPRVSPQTRAGWIFRFIGRNPPMVEVRSGVEFCGFVSDLGGVLNEADAAFIPLRSGDGVKLKTLTLLGAGLATVSTRHGIEGLPVADRRDCLITDDAQQFADAFDRLNDPQLRSRLGSSAASVISAYNSRSGSADVFREALQLAAGSIKTNKPRRGPRVASAPSSMPSLSSATVNAV